MLPVNLKIPIFVKSEAVYFGKFFSVIAKLLYYNELASHVRFGTVIENIRLDQ